MTYRKVKQIRSLAELNFMTVSSFNPQPVAAAEPPALQGVMHQLDPRSITVNRIAMGIFFIVVAVGSTIGVIVFWLSGQPSPLPLVAAVVAAVVNVLLLCTAIFWPAIEHRHTSWQTGETGVEINRGVFWKHQIAIPWARVQHADVSQGPLERMYELGSLTIHTAGTKHASVSLEGLSHETAIQLRDEVVRQRQAADVV